MNYEHNDNGGETFAFADYGGVVLMIQTYHYKMVEMFRQYYYDVLRQRDFQHKRQAIQSCVVTLVQLLKRYDSVIKKSTTKNLFSDIDKFILTQNTMNFSTLKQCIDSVMDAHHALGLSNIELKKPDKGRAIMNFNN